VVAEGAFGIDFASDPAASATITPRFDPQWPEAHAEFRLRGVDLTMGYLKGSKAGITLRRKQAEGGGSVGKVSVRLVWQGRTKIVVL
jgi:hypothetical protein